MRARKLIEQFGLYPFGSSSPSYLKGGPGGYEYHPGPYEVGLAGGPGGYARLDLGSMLNDDAAKQQVRQIIAQARMTPGANLINAKLNAMALITQITDPNARADMFQFLASTLGKPESVSRARRILTTANEDELRGQRFLGYLRRLGYTRDATFKSRHFHRYGNPNGDEVLLHRSGSHLVHSSPRNGVKTFNSPTDYFRYDRSQHRE